MNLLLYIYEPARLLKYTKLLADKLDVEMKFENGA